MPELLRLSRSTMEALTGMQRQLIRALERDALLAARVEWQASILSVGRVVALTSAQEMGDISSFTSVKKAVSYCGLCGAEKSSCGKTDRTPILNQRNKHLETTLIEAAKLALRWSTDLALVEREKQRGNRNRATLALARKLVAYLLAVDREQGPFDTMPPPLGFEAGR